MTTTFTPPVRTVGELLRRLGDVSADRVRFTPVPGTATVADLLRDENRRSELVDDTLVEKLKGVRESFLALILAELLNHHVRGRNLGILTARTAPTSSCPASYGFPTWRSCRGTASPDGDSRTSRWRTSHLTSRWKS